VKNGKLKEKGGNMPPSGFDKTHTQGIKIFLENCVKDLINENKGLRNPREALQRELDHIATDLNTETRPPAETAVLMLAKDFYHRTQAWIIIRYKKDQTYEALQEGADLVIEQICEGIESIKVLEG
jgi:hypothetical protein